MQGKPSAWHNSKCSTNGSCYIVICSNSLMKGWRAEVVRKKGRHVPISAQRKVGSKYLKIVTNDLMNERQAPPQAAQIHRKGINSLLSTLRVIPLKAQVLPRCLCAFSCSSL